MKKLFSILLAAIILLSLVSCAAQGGKTQASASSAAAASSGSSKSSGSASTSSKPVRVACILSGPISDMSWNYTAHQGLLKIEAMGAEISYQEKIDNSALPDCINTYASDGYDLIFLSTNSYEESAMQFVKDYPNTQFVIINGKTSVDNVTSYAVADEDQGFMQGVICASLTKSNKVGFVGAMEITPILNGRSGFEQGVKYVNSNVAVNAVMTGSFTDVAAAKETTTAMIESGADIVAPMCDNAALGVVEAAEDKGALAVASGEGQNTIAPNAVVCAVIKDTSIVYVQAYQDYLAGKLKGNTEVLKLGAADGVVYLSDWYTAGSSISDDTKSAIQNAYQALSSGKVSITLS